MQICGTTNLFTASNCTLLEIDTKPNLQVIDTKPNLRIGTTFQKSEAYNHLKNLYNMTKEGEKEGKWENVPYHVRRSWLLLCWSPPLLLVPPGTRAAAC
jgi:hypothetical protein